MSDLIDRDFIKSLGGKCIAYRDEKTNELFPIIGIDALPSSQPDLQLTCNQLATDCISRKAAIDAIHEEWDECLNVDESGETIAYETEDVICRLPSAQLTLYGYNIEHLAYIARVMEKEGITAEVAVNTFLDVGHAVKMILDEVREIAEREIFK